MYLVCVCVLFLGVTSDVVSQTNDLPNTRWDEDPFVQDIAKELGKFLKEYIEKYCKNSTQWMDVNKSDEHPVYIKSSMELTEPEEETLVIRREIVSNLPDKELPGDRRAATEGSTEVPLSDDDDNEDDDDSIVLEIEDQPKDSKSVLTANELILHINGPEGTRRSSITLPNDLQQIIGAYLRLRRRRRKRFNVSLVENNHIQYSGDSNADTFMYRRADEPVSDDEDTEDDPDPDRRFVRVVRNKQLKPKKLFSAGIRIGMVPGDPVDYKISKPVDLQMGFKKIPGFKHTPSFPSGSIQFGTKPQINMYELKGQPIKSFGFKHQPYDMYEYKLLNKKPKGQFSIELEPGEYTPGQDKSPFGFSKLSLQNKPYDYQFDIPGSPGQMQSPYGSMEFPIGGVKRPYGPDIYPQQYEIPGPIQFGMPRPNIPGPIDFGIPGPSFQPRPVNMPYEIPGQMRPYGGFIDGPPASFPYSPGYAHIPSHSFNLPVGSRPPVSFRYGNLPSPNFYRDPVYGVTEIRENFDPEQFKLKFPEVRPPGQSKYDLPGQKSEIPGQTFEMPGQKFEIPGGYTPGQVNTPSDSFKLPTNQNEMPGQKFEIPGGYTPGQVNIPSDSFKLPTNQNEMPGQKFEIPGQKFEIPGGYTPGQVNIPSGPLGNKPYESEMPANDYQNEMPGQKFENPGGYTPGQFNKPSDSFKLPTNQNEMPGQKFEIPGQTFEIPGGYTPGQVNIPSYPLGNKPYESEIPANDYQNEMPGQKFEIPGHKFEIPGGYTPGQFNIPSGSFKISLGNKPYDNKVPANDYQNEMPGQKFEIPGQKYEIPGGYTPGQYIPSGGFTISLGNKPYDNEIPANDYQYEMPGQKYEIPGGYSPGQFNIPSGSFKLSLGNKPYDNQYEMPGLSPDDAKPPYGPDITYKQYELPGQKNPMQMDLPQFDIKPGFTKYQYSLPSQNYEIPVHSQSVKYTQYTPGDIYYQKSSQPVASYRESYSIRPSYTDEFRRKAQDANDTAQAEPEKTDEHDPEPENDVQPKAYENPPAQRMPEDLRHELLRRAMQQITKEFNEDMKRVPDQPEPVKIPEHATEETDDNKNQQEQTEEPQTEEPNRRGVNEIDEGTTKSTPQHEIPSMMVTLAEPVKNQTNSSEEGYVFGISADSSDEEATLANTYRENSRLHQDNSDEHGRRHNCDDTSDAEYEYDDDESEEKTIVKPEVEEKPHKQQDVALKWAVKKVQDLIDTENATQAEEELPHMIEINMTKVRRFGDQPESFNGSLETVEPYVISPNSSEITDDNLPNENEDGPSNTGPFDIDGLFPPANTSDGRRSADNMTMIISDTIQYDGEPAKPEVLPVNPSTELTDLITTEKYFTTEEPTDVISTEKYFTTEEPTDFITTEKYSTTEEPTDFITTVKYFTTKEPTDLITTEKYFTTEEPTDLITTERYSTIEEPVQNLTDTPMQRMNTEVFEPTTAPVETIDDNVDTSELIPQDTAPEEVSEPVFTDETSEQQTETPDYTESVEYPTATETVEVEYSTPGTFAPDGVADYTESVGTVTYTEFPSITTDVVTHAVTMEAIEHDTDVSTKPSATIADMGKDIDYIQYYGTEDPGNEITVEETTTASTDLEYTTLNLLDGPTTIEFTTLDYEDTPTTDTPTTDTPTTDTPTTDTPTTDTPTTDTPTTDTPTTDTPTTDTSTTDTPTTDEAVPEESQENVLGNSDVPQRRNKPSEASVEETPTEPSFENALPFLKHKLMSKDYQDAGNNENYILEDILEKPQVDLTDEEKVSFERMVDLSKNPDNVTFDHLPENYRPLDSNDDQFLLRGLLNDGILDNDYLRKGVILLKNYPFEKDLGLLKTRMSLKGILRDFKNDPNATTSEENHMNLVLSHLATHPKELDSVYEAMVKKRGEPDSDELTLIDEWLQLLKYNKGIELMYLYDNNGGGPENDFRTFLMENLMKKDPEALSEDEQRLFDILLLIYKINFVNRPNKKEQDIIEDDLYKQGIITMHNSPNQANPGLLSQELLEFVFKKQDTELNEWEYKIYNYLMKLMKNPNELLKRYNEVMGTVKSDLDEKYVELNNGKMPTSFEEMSTSLNDILTKKDPEEMTPHDYYILFLLQYLADNKELIPHLANFEHNMIYDLSLFKFGIITIANSPNRNKKQLLSDEILKTVMKKLEPELNAKEYMIYKQLMDVPANHAYLMDTYNFIMNMLKDSVGEDNIHGRKNKYMVAIIKIPIKSRDENGEIITNKTIKINMDDIHPSISNLAGQPIDNEQAVFIMPEEDSDSLTPLDLDDKTKLVHKLEVTRESMKVNRAHPTEYVAVIPQYLDDLVPDLVRLLQSGSTQALNESGEINYDVNDNEPGKNLQQLVGHTILQIRRRKTNPTEVDDDELIQHLTTLQRILMKEIKSEYGTTDFKQQPVKIERRYMADEMEPDEQYYDQDGELPTEQRRGLMNTPVQLAMNAVAKWFMAQNQMQQPHPYRRSDPQQYRAGPQRYRAGPQQYRADRRKYRTRKQYRTVPQQQNFQNDKASRSGHRRQGLLDTPVQLAMKAVAKWFTAQNQMQPQNSYRRNVPDQYDSPQDKGFQEEMTVPHSQRRAIMDAPVELIKNTVRKFGEAPNLLQSLTSFRRNVPDEHVTDIPSEHTSLKAIVEPARRYMDYFEDSAEDYLYDDEIDPVVYVRRNNIEQDGRKEEIEEPTSEKVMPEANRRSDYTKTGNRQLITLKIKPDKGRPHRNNRRKIPRNVKQEENIKVWVTKDSKKRSATTDEADKQELIPTRRAMPWEDHGDDEDDAPVMRKPMYRKRGHRGKYGRNLRRRRARRHPRQPETGRRFDPHRYESPTEQVLSTTDTGQGNVFLPTTPEVDVQNASTELVPQRRQFPFSMISGLMPFGGGGGNPMGGGGGGFNPMQILGGLNPFQMLGMRRNKDKEPGKQTERVRILGEDTAQHQPQGEQMNYNGQNNGQGYYPHNNGQPNNVQINGQPYVQHNVPNHNPQDNIQTYTDGNVSPDYATTPGPVNNPGQVPQAGQMNYNPQNNMPNYNPQHNIQTYTDGNVSPDYATTPGPANNPGQVPQAGQMNYNPQNNVPNYNPQHNIQTYTDGNVSPDYATTPANNPGQVPQAEQNGPIQTGPIDPNLEPSQKTRRSADSTSLLSMLNPVEFARRLNPFKSREETPPEEVTENSTKLEENQEEEQTQQSEITAEDERRSMDNVESSTDQENSDTTEYSLQTNIEETVTSQYIPEAEYNETRRRGIDIEDDTNITDNEETTMTQENINTTDEDNITDVQEQDTTELVQDSPQDQDSGIETTGNSTISSETETT